MLSNIVTAKLKNKRMGHEMDQTFTRVCLLPVLTTMTETADKFSPPNFCLCSRDYDSTNTDEFAGLTDRRAIFLMTSS